MTHHFQYWLGTGWWCLGLARASPSLPVAHTFAVIWSLVCMFCHAFLASYGVGFFRFAILYDLLLLGVEPCWIIGLPSPRPILCSLSGIVSIFLSYHSAIPTVMLFDSILLGLFGSAVYFPPNDLVCSLGLFLHCL